MKTIRKDVSSVRLKSLYVGDKVDLQVTEFKHKYRELVFENDEGAVKVSIVYFVELALVDREIMQNMDMSLFGVVDD